MENLTENILGLLPSNGDTISGGQVKEKLGIDDEAFKKAKEEIKTMGVAVFGRGRGGTIGLRVEGKEKKPTPKKDFLVAAREVKKSNIREKKKRDMVRAIAREWAEENFPDAIKIDIMIWRLWEHDAECYIWAGDAKRQQVYFKEFVFD